MLVYNFVLVWGIAVGYISWSQDSSEIGDLESIELA